VVSLEFLKKVPIFSGALETQLVKIQHIITEKSYLSSEIIICDGDQGNTMFILLEGDVNISKKLTLLSDEDDTDLRDKVLIKLSASMNAVFGEMALFEKESQRSATVTAHTNCKCGIINKTDFLSIIENDHELGYIIYKNISIMLSDRLKKANKDIVKLTTALSLALGE